MGMVGVRDVFVVAPAYHPRPHHQDAAAAGGIPASDAASSDHQINCTAATALGVGIIPLLTAAPSLTAAAPPQNMEDTDLNFLGNSRSNKIAGIQFWQNQPSTQAQYFHSKSLPTNVSPMNLMQTGSVPNGGSGFGGRVGSSSNSGSGSGSTTCQDCGNQAKKECSHNRCRTCCKSRGLDCVTHVKSTWVPAARRRERHLMAAAVGGGGGNATGSSVSTSGTKKPRLQHQQQTTSHTSTSNNTLHSLDTTSSHQEGRTREGFPWQIRAPAAFKCVKVTALEDGEDEYAYQAVVNIGGHVFKGFLYDQGVDPKGSFPDISDLHLGGSGGTGGLNGNNGGATTSSPVLDPPDLYGGGGFLGNSGYG